MFGWVGDIATNTLDNDSFRTVVFTGARMQLTVMRLRPGEDIGKESHSHLDHFLRIEQGDARVELGGGESGVDEIHNVHPGWAIFVPGGVWHNIVNTGERELKLWSLYSPPKYTDESEM